MSNIDRDIHYTHFTIKCRNPDFRRRINVLNKLFSYEWKSHTQTKHVIYDRFEEKFTSKIFLKRSIVGLLFTYLTYAYEIFDIYSVFCRYGAINRCVINGRIIS